MGAEVAGVAGSGAVTVGGNFTQGKQRHTFATGWGQRKTKNHNTTSLVPPDRITQNTSIQRTSDTVSRMVQYYLAQCTHSATDELLLLLLITHLTCIALSRCTAFSLVVAGMISTHGMLFVTAAPAKITSLWSTFYSLSFGRADKRSVAMMGHGRLTE